MQQSEDGVGAHESHHGHEERTGIQHFWIWLKGVLGFKRCWTSASGYGICSTSSAVESRGRERIDLFFFKPLLRDLQGGARDGGAKPKIAGANAGCRRGRIAHPTCSADHAGHLAAIFAAATRVLCSTNMLSPREAREPLAVCRPRASHRPPTSSSCTQHARYLHISLSNGARQFKHTRGAFHTHNGRLDIPRASGWISN